MMARIVIVLGLSLYLLYFVSPSWGILGSGIYFLAVAWCIYYYRKSIRARPSLVNLGIGLCTFGGVVLVGLGSGGLA